MERQSDKPQRLPTDGAILVEKLPHTGHVMVSVTSEGHTEVILMSTWNARRVFASLAVVLGLPLQKKIAESIEMG